jgi:flavoprotein
MTLKDKLMEIMVDFMHKYTEDMLRIWLVDGNKEQVLRYYNCLSKFHQETFLGALKEVIGKSENAELRQAAIDIPAYIKASQAK